MSTTPEQDLAGDDLDAITAQAEAAAGDQRAAVDEWLDAPEQDLAGDDLAAVTARAEAAAAASGKGPTGRRRIFDEVMQDAARRAREGKPPLPPVEAPIEQRGGSDEWTRRAPRRYHHAIPTGLVGEQRAAVDEWLDALSVDPRDGTLLGPTLLLAGPGRAGKTHTALAACRAVMQRADLRGQRDAVAPHAASRSHPFAFWPVGRLIRAFVPYGLDPIAEHCEQVDVLVLDDMGAEPIRTDYQAGRLYDLINARYNDGRPTITTTNLALVGDDSRPSPVEAEVGPRVWRRLSEDAIAYTLPALDGPPDGVT